MSTNPALNHQSKTQSLIPVDANWERQWARVPERWRSGNYRLDQAPFNEVFVRNINYLRSVKTYHFVPESHVRIRQEASWWLWSIWAEGSKKIDPSMLMWWGRAISTLATQRAELTGNPVSEMSVADFDPVPVIREALRDFSRRNKKYPAAGSTRNLESAAQSIHSHVYVRCSSAPWWAHDTWDMRLDPRIPRRPHEPNFDCTINLGGIEPAWLREGLRFYLSQNLILDQYTWTTIGARTVSIGSRFGTFLTEQGIESPILGQDLKAIRKVTMAFIGWLRELRTSKDQPLSSTSISHIESHVHLFYTWMLENKDAAADFTNNPAWAELTSNHALMFPPARSGIRKGNKKGVRYYDDADLATLLAHLPVLATPTNQSITIDHAGTTQTFRGLGDPQAARIWEIQALTGRRKSEVCLMDRNPLTMLNFEGQPASGPADPDAYVARMTYQQTKVDDVDPTVLVQQAVVNIIIEQQRWIAQNRPEAINGPYLFLQLRGNYQGHNPRPPRTYGDSLKRLDRAVKLTSHADGKPLLYTETHRLRHTRATTLLNAGVPIHVLQRYLGHKSPDMSMRYAQTLDSTAQEAFLKLKQIGADGRDVNIAPQDLIDLQQLDRRANRILPNGLCVLPPTKKCDKGNACLPCGSFATDITYLEDHKQQRDRIAAHFQVVRAQHEKRHGTPMPDTNTWVEGRLREIASLDAIITRLEQEDTTQGATVKGAGSSAQGVPLKLITDPIGKSAARQTLNDQLRL